MLSSAFALRCFRSWYMLRSTLLCSPLLCIPLLSCALSWHVLLRFALLYATVWNAMLGYMYATLLKRHETEYVTMLVVVTLRQMAFHTYI